MGGAQSKSDDPQPPPTVRQGLFKSEALRPAARQPPLLREPWREINWQENENSLQYVKDYKPLIEGQQLRILLHGPVGAGKSSFINSVQTVLRGRMYTQALVDNISHGCFTKMYTTYKIQKPGKGSLYPFVFNDIMGLDANKGVLVDDIKLALKGHVKEGYRFNPESRLSEDNHFYNNCPTDNDRVHILVCVVPANTGSILRDEIVNKIRQIRMEATELRIPQVVILTKIDEACPEIKQDLKNVYKVQYVKEKVCWLRSGGERRCSREANRSSLAVKLPGSPGPPEPGGGAVTRLSVLLLLLLSHLILISFSHPPPLSHYKTIRKSF